MANPYPIEIQAGDAEGPIVIGGLATFTDLGNQPGGGFTPAVVTAADSPYVALPGSLVVVDTSGGPVEIDLPDTPPDGSEVAVWVIDASNQVTVEGPINGGSEIDLTELYSQLVVVYVADQGTWAVLSEGVPGSAGGSSETELVGAQSDTIANGSGGSLTWAHVGGDALLDYTDPLAPTVIAAGVYAVSVDYQATFAMTASGGFICDLTLDASGLGAEVASASNPALAYNNSTPTTAITIVAEIPAGGSLVATLTNMDGVQDGMFAFGGVVCKIS